MLLLIQRAASIIITTNFYHVISINIIFTVIIIIIIFITFTIISKQMIVDFPRDFEILGWCPAGPVLSHGEKVPR